MISFRQRPAFVWYPSPLPALHKLQRLVDHSTRFWLWCLTTHLSDACSAIGNLEYGQLRIRNKHNLAPVTTFW
ncbi:hypothetical protein A0H81_09869 [Grifola frondosa]|uniref:Uncharacterized protein n=1 Tax=Grifola frondosa TaxID=5627 RepID=A0A1C7M0E2_GRIFR|nr:hypothetical protein A0H81_09869 [Grifola frondosa]